VVCKLRKTPAIKLMMRRITMMTSIRNAYFKMCTVLKKLKHSE